MMKMVKLVVILMVMKIILIYIFIDKIYDIEEYKNKNISLDCKPTKLNTRCEISLRNYYPSKPIVKRLCFPKMANEIKFDIANHEKIEIYDTKSQNKIEKIINKDQFYIDQNNNKYVLVYY